MARILQADARKRPSIQIRIYGELADMIEDRAEREGKGRSTLVDELLRAAWHLASPDPTPIAPRSQDTPQDAPHAVAPRRAHVFAPPPGRWRA